jgi:ComF family protein
LESDSEILCNVCLGLIQPIVTCPIKITDSYDVTVFAIGLYKDPLKQLVVAKHHRNRLAAQDLGHLLWILSDLKYAEFDYIVPLPLHWSRYAFRWYNQAEEIAQVISRYSGKPVVHLLARNKKTVFQSGLSREERMLNVKNVFTVKNKDTKYVDASILLIDDVLTTGATIKAAVKALKILQAKKIIVGVGCRVI